MEAKICGLGLSELRELRQLREENAKLKRLVTDLSLDRQMLQEIVRKKLYGLGTAGSRALGANDLSGQYAPGLEAVADGASLVAVSGLS